MSGADLTVAASTIWVVVAAILVMFMQAGFAFLEAGLTRMKNVAHVAAKTVLVFGIVSVVYYLVGFGIAFGDGGNGFAGGSGFAPSVDELLAVGRAPFSWFSSIPGAAGYLFQVVFAGVSLVIAVLGVLLVERIGIDDPVGAVAVHGMSGVWGTLATGLFAVPALADNLATGQGGLVYTGSFHQLGVQALGLAVVGAFTFSLSFLALWAMKRSVGIRVEEKVETAGLDVSEHGMWGYPEFYIPVPGGYGTEAHGHLGLRHGEPHVHAGRPAPAPQIVPEAS